MTPEQLEILRKYRITIPVEMKCDVYHASDLFNFLEKNTGLTEEYIYNNGNPTSLQLPVYSASYEPIGQLPNGFIKDGKPLKVCNGEVIIIFRQGYAGQMYIPKEKIFYASEHTIPIQVKPKHKDRLNQHWFAQYYQPEVMHFVTGKADSGNFSELAFSKMTFLIPPRKWQDECAELYVELSDELGKVGQNISELSLKKVLQPSPTAIESGKRTKRHSKLKTAP
jgi:restriction endonuclease S subunit